MTSPLAGEFLGTMILILLGDGVVAAVLLKRSKADGSGWMVIAVWCLPVRGGNTFTLFCLCRCVARFFQCRSGRPSPPQDSAHISWGAWSGASASLWVGRPDTRSIRHETLGRASRTRFFRLPGKADRTGAMRRFP